MMFPFGELKNLFRRKITRKGRVYKLSNAEIKKTKNEIDKLFMTMYRILFDKIKRRMMQESALSRYEIVVRSLLPKDLGLEKEWKFKLSKKEIVDCISSDYEILGIFGIHIPKNCPVTQLEVLREGSPIRKLNIQFLEGDYFFDDPFIIERNNRFVFEIYPTGRKTTSLGFYGIVAERKGITVAE